MKSHLSSNLWNKTMYEINTVLACAEERIEPRAAELLSRLVERPSSIANLSRLIRSGGVAALESHLGLPVQDLEVSSQVFHVASCMVSGNNYAVCYASASSSERTTDMFGISRFIFSDRVIYLYGENASNASRYDRTLRWEEDRSGKLCDYLLKVNDCEVGVGENSGGLSCDHHMSTQSKFVDLLKVAKSQYSYLCREIDQRKTTDEHGSLAAATIKKITIPCFFIIRRSVRFYVVKRLNDDLLMFYRWHEEQLPCDDSDSAAIASLCRGFLIQYYLADGVYETNKTAIQLTRLQGFRLSDGFSGDRSDPLLRTPIKRASKSRRLD